MPGVEAFTPTNLKTKGKKTMTGKILDGKSLVQQLESELTLRVQHIIQPTIKWQNTYSGNYPGGG